MRVLNNNPVLLRFPLLVFFPEGIVGVLPMNAVPRIITVAEKFRDAVCLPPDVKRVRYLSCTLEPLVSPRIQQPFPVKCCRYLCIRRTVKEHLKHTHHIRGCFFVMDYLIPVSRVPFQTVGKVACHASSLCPVTPGCRLDFFPRSLE